MDKWLLAAGFVLFALMFYFIMRFNMHMFQLNGYKNKEHLNWLKKNIKKQAFILWLPVFVVPAFAAFLTDITVLKIVATVWACVIFAAILKYYTFLKKQKNKKKLVFTARVKRLVATDCLFNLVILLLLFVFTDEALVWLFFGLLAALQPYMVILMNIFNRPIEKAVTNYYINDAKNMLKAMPGLKIIGVTGSYGKTSVKYYLSALLQSRFNVLITPESFNTPMGVVRTIREGLKSTHEIFVCEMGARHVGDIKELCDIVHPQHGIITSVGPQHLETFYSIENIINTKFELADALPEGGKLFLNGDNEYINKKSSAYEDKTFYATSVKTTEADSTYNGYYAKDIRVSQFGTEFVAVTPDGEEESFSMRIIGQHNVVNVMGAIAVAHSFGVPLKDLKVPVRKLQPVAHRLQMLEKGDVTIIDDAYNSNPAGSKAAVETLAMFEGLKILITPGMVELGKEEERYNYEFGTYAAKCCDYILLVGKEHTKPIAEGVKAGGFLEEHCKTFEKLEEAVAFAYGIASEQHKYILLENDLPDNY